jgi:hypothetical protein
MQLDSKSVGHKEQGIDQGLTVNTEDYLEGSDTTSSHRQGCGRGLKPSCTVDKDASGDVTSGQSEGLSIVLS